MAWCIDSESVLVTPCYKFVTIMTDEKLHETSWNFFKNPRGAIGTARPKPHSQLLNSRSQHSQQMKTSTTQRGSDFELTY